MDMVPTELITLIAGSATGFLFRHMAENRKNAQENFQRLLDARKQADDSANQARQRVPIDTGKGVRQLIVLVVLFGTIIAPFILPFFGIPTVVEVQYTSPEWLFGLIPSSTETIFQTVNGFLYTSENRQVLLAIVAFFFGSAAAGNKT
jgi:hypothetical protein